MQDNTLCRLILISQRYAKQLNINFTPRTHLIFIHVYRISIRIKKKKNHSIVLRLISNIFLICHLLKGKNIFKKKKITNQRTKKNYRFLE